MMSGAKLAKRMIPAIITACIVRDLNLSVNFIFVTCYEPASCHFPVPPPLTLPFTGHSESKRTRRPPGTLFLCTLTCLMEHLVLHAEFLRCFGNVTHVLVSPSRQRV